jgi:hypothetical protein
MEGCSQRDRVVVRHLFCRSWPGLSRPPTHLLLRRRKQDVDARDTRGHGGAKVMRSPRDAH